MLVQHGVRHLLLADDRPGNQQTQNVPLLDTYHPFPSLPPKKHANAVDPTPVRTTVSVSAGQIVTIGSLDRSIRRHSISLTIRPPSHAPQTNSDPTWFDIAVVGQLPDTNRSGTNQPMADQRIQTNNANSDHSSLTSLAAEATAATGKLPPGVEAARRFQLPFFRQGNVYQRTLIRQLIRHDKRITIYGDLTNPQHLEVASAIQQCGISPVLNFVSNSIGRITDLDGDGRLALVLGQLADSAPVNSDQEPIRGCVRPADFQKGKPGSVDVIYLDPTYLKANELQSLLAHEIAHAATFSLLVESGQSPTAMPGWLNEAIAHHIEQQIAPEAENLQQRRRLFQTKTWLYPSVIPEEFTGMELRRGPSRIASLELLRSTLTSDTDQNLKTLITGRGDGINRLLVANRTDFPKLFRNFTQHLVRHNATHQGANTAYGQNLFEPGSNNLDATENQQSSTFDLTRPSDQAIQIRGTSVAISSPATVDCELVISTTRDALAQITVFQSPTAN